VGLEPPTTFVDPALVLRFFEWPANDPEAALRRYVENS